MKALLILGFILLNCFCEAQPKPNYSSSDKKAIQAFEDGRAKYEYKKNDDAYQFLEKAVKLDADFYEAQMLLGDVCADLGKWDESALAYRKALDLNPERFQPLRYNLAGTLIRLKQFDEAKALVETFLTKDKISPELRKKGERRLGQIAFMKEAFLNPVPFNPINLGAKVNSVYNEYHPSFTVDENVLIFTRMRPSDEFTDNGGARFEEDFYISRKESDGNWSIARPMGPPVNTNKNEGAHCISPDGVIFFFTGCNRRDGLGSCDLYMSRKTANNWSTPVNMGEPVNSSAWDSQPTISSDGSTLIFVSRRPGGFGASDLWMTTIEDNGNWSNPVNLGDSVNTDQDEFGPFFHPDGKTLYFSSSGHPGMGGKDLFFVSKKDDGTWSTPKNLGYPINTEDDEIHMVVSADGNTGYISSNREGGFGERDIYRFDLPPNAKPSPVSFMRGKVVNKKDGTPIQARFELIELSTGITKVVSYSDAKTGEFLVSLPIGSPYALNISNPGFLFYSDNITLTGVHEAKDAKEINIFLNPIIQGEAIILNNIFFETGSSILKTESMVELNKLHRFMEANVRLKVEVGGHTDNVGDDNSNMKLSSERAKAVVDFLKTKGIDAARMVPKGYGETKPIATNDTEEGRMKNRRTEFSILSN